MKHLHWLTGVALCVSLSGALAAEGDKAPGEKKGDQPGVAREKRGDKVPETPKADKRAIERIEQLNGKPLTEEQTKAVQAAWAKRGLAQKAIEEQYRTELAQALGITVADLMAKEKEMRKPEGDKKEAPKPDAPKDAPKPDAPKN